VVGIQNFHRAVVAVSAAKAACFLIFFVGVCLDIGKNPTILFLNRRFLFKCSRWSFTKSTKKKNQNLRSTFFVQILSGHQRENRSYLLYFQ
jgi:hypothetical protein